jgi:hypothetical protein
MFENIPLSNDGQLGPKCVVGNLVDNNTKIDMIYNTVEQFQHKK